MIVKYFPIRCMFSVSTVLLIVRTDWKERIHGIVANCLYLKVPELANLRNQNRKRSEIITSSPYKKLQQGQERKTELNKYQIKHKQKKQHWNQKTKKQKNALSTVCKRSLNKIQIDWTVCRICTVWVHEGWIANKACFLCE